MKTYIYLVNKLTPLHTLVGRRYLDRRGFSAVRAPLRPQFTASGANIIASSLITGRFFCAAVRAASLAVLRHDDGVCATRPTDELGEAISAAVA
ncbi:hypothetical protein [Enteractinococcus helveticum]|uniref:hypothetical protein n=1 Tax=Enteractinococcus helveticum TaxID=1837282 RepID=UPI0012374034|nr:hypothetical protein [Enteractinococcus helveticum]